MIKFLFVCLLCSYIYFYFILSDPIYELSIGSTRIVLLMSFRMKFRSKLSQSTTSSSNNSTTNFVKSSIIIEATNNVPRQHSVKNMNVEYLIKQKAVNNSILLYCTDNGYIDLFLNGYYASQLWKYKNLVVTCFDRLCYKRLDALNIPVALLNVENDTSVDITKAAICHTKEFQNKVHYKLVLWNIAINLNVRILYVDSDVILLKDPFYYLNSFTGYDILAQRDGNLCSGFMYMYPTKNTKLAVERSINIRPSLPDPMDQEALIAAIDTIEGFQLNLLPWNIIPSGEYFFESHNYYWDPINSQQLTVHNNFIHGLENKLYRFKEIKMYKLDRNQEYSNPSAKYLTIENWGISFIALFDVDQRSELMKAINLAIQLKRILVVPPFRCRMRSHFCTLFDIFGSDGSNAIVSRWKDVIRESVCV